MPSLARNASRFGNSNCGSSAVRARAAGVPATSLPEHCTSIAQSSALWLYFPDRDHICRHHG